MAAREYGIDRQQCQIALALLHTGISFCCFGADVSLLLVAINRPLYAVKGQQMRKRLMRACFWSIARHFEVIKKLTSLHL